MSPVTQNARRQESGVTLAYHPSKEGDLRKRGTGLGETGPYFEGYPHKGLRGRIRKAGKDLTQRALLNLAKRRGLYLARGPHHPANRIDPDPFARGLWIQSSDFVRYAVLELLVREIQTTGVPGDAAELGVFQGHFAAAINRHLSDRHLYLFDTFEGFDKRDRAGEAARGITSKTNLPFASTSLDFVRGQMPYPHMVEPIVGWFPESARDLGDLRFCLVSIDADLYDPILAGLQWFYERLNPGGYLIVHDYNNADFPGVQKALRDFVEQRGAAYVPVPDSGGSMVIGRPSVIHGTTD